MEFDVLGEISQIETFAAGSGIGKSPGCADSTVGGAGENARELGVFD